MTPQEAKQKAIIEAYGEYYDKWKDYIDSEGYFFNGGEELFLSYGQCKGTPLEYCDYLEDVYLRPMTLRGLEDNRGWTRIEPDGSNLPKHEGQYVVYSKVDWHPYYRIDIFSGRLSNSIHHETGKPIFTHYQPIIKPQPPIY